jgi:hypothetical protein
MIPGENMEKRFGGPIAAIPADRVSRDYQRRCNPMRGKKTNVRVVGACPHRYWVYRSNAVDFAPTGRSDVNVGPVREVLAQG